MRGDAEEFTYSPDGFEPCEIGTQCLKNEGQGILAIRDNEIRKDGMGMTAAFTFNPADMHQTLMYVAIYEINQETVIRGKETAIPG